MSTRALRLAAALSVAYAVTSFVSPCVAQNSAARTPASPTPSATMPAVVVTGARGPIAITDSWADVTVISRDEIQRSGQSSVIEILRGYAGVQITANGGPGSTSNVFLRGANPGQTVVLVDGMRISSSTTGTPSWWALPLAQIDRIEILRGPASSLYGADAIGGVVQIFTRVGDGPARLTGGLGYGSYDTVLGDAAVAGGDERIRYSVRAGFGSSSGFNAIRNPRAFGFNPDRDGYQSFNVGGNVGVTLARGHEIGVQAFESRQDAEYDGGANFDHRTKTTARTAAISSTNQITGYWTSRLRLGETSDLNDNIASPTSTTTFDSRQRQYAWQHDLRFGTFGVQAAIERREERVSSTTQFAIKSRDTNAGLLLLRWTPGSHLIQASGRIDDDSQFGARSTGNLAYGY